MVCGGCAKLQATTARTCRLQAARGRGLRAELHDEGDDPAHLPIDARGDVYDIYDRWSKLLRGEKHYSPSL